MRSGSSLRQTVPRTFLQTWMRALGPAVLLALEAVHVRRQFRGHDDVREVNEAPALHLRAVAQVHVLGERVMLPAAGVDDAPLAPDAGGAVEVEEECRRGCAPSAPARGDRRASSPGAGSGAIGPCSKWPQRACTMPTCSSVKWWIIFLQQVRRRHEIRVENEQELALRGRQSPLPARRP